MGIVIKSFFVRVIIGYVVLGGVGLLFIVIRFK